MPDSFFEEMELVRFLLFRPVRPLLRPREKGMNRWNSERMLGWAAALAVGALVVVGTSTLVPLAVPKVIAVLGQGSALAGFGLCVAAVVVEPQRRP